MTALEHPWPSSLAPAVTLVRLDGPVIDALAIGDLPSAGALAPVPLSEYVTGPESARVWRVRSEQIRSNPGDAAWTTRVVHDPARRLTVGIAGFHGPPDSAGMVEVGYAIDPVHRRRGYARAALSAMLERARVEATARVVRASIRPDNEASRALVAQFGFVEVGEQWDDEDGLELLFDLAMPSDA